MADKVLVEAAGVHWNAVRQQFLVSDVREAATEMGEFIEDSDYRTWDELTETEQIRYSGSLLLAVVVSRVSPSRPKATV